MIRVVVLACGLLAVSTAYPCRTAPGSQAASNQADRTKQRSLVRELTLQADAIFVGKAVRVAASGDSAEFSIDYALKGAKPTAGVVTYATPTEITVGCDVADQFRDVVLTEGQTYILYVASGRLIRAGDIHRKWPEITSKEEIQLVRKGVGT